MVWLSALKRMLIILQMDFTAPVSATQSEIKKASCVVYWCSALAFWSKTTRSPVLITSPVLNSYMLVTDRPWLSFMASRNSFLRPRDKDSMPSFHQLRARKAWVSGSLVMTRTMVSAGLSETPLISTSSTLKTKNTRTTQSSNWRARRPLQLVAFSLSQQFWCEPLSSLERHSESTNDSLFEKLY